MVKDVMKLGEVMLGFIRGNGYGFHGGKCGVDEVEVQEIPRVKATEASDEAANAKVA